MLEELKYRTSPVTGKGKVFYIGKRLHDWGNGYTGGNTGCPFYQAVLQEWGVKLADLRAGENPSIITALELARAETDQAPGDPLAGLPKTDTVLVQHEMECESI